MVKLVTTLCAALALAAAAAGDDAAVRAKARARAALAVSEPAAATCGACRTDYDGCLAEAIDSGRPLVVVVNKACGQKGVEYLAGGALVCRQEAFAHDGQPAAKPRVVVMSRSPTVPNGVRIHDTLPIDSPASVVNDRVKVAAAATGYKLPPPSGFTAPPPRPKSGLNWD